jgi:hypothetical protein
MPKPGAIDQLSPEQRAVFELELIRRNFADYDGFVEWLNASGFEISRSSAYRHGAKLKRRILAVKNSTEAARMIAEAAPDDSDLRSAAVISLVQSELFDVMVSLQDLDDAKPGERVALLKEASKSVLDMTRASTLQKEWQLKNTARIRQEARAEAAEQLTTELKNDGISAELEASIKRILLGK